MRYYIIVLLSLIMSFSLSASNLFSTNESSEIVATKNKDNTLGLFLSLDIYKKIVLDKKENFSIEIPFFNNNINVKLKRINFISEDLQIVSSSNNGSTALDINPDILSYKMYYLEKSIGVINFYDDNVSSTFKINNKQYEITKYKNEYILFEASNSINNFNFSCAVDEVAEINYTNRIQRSFSSSAPVCVELAIEIDYYTRQTFATDQQASNWALAIIAGVSQIYESETNSAIQVVHINIWNTIDPFAGYIAQASAMLGELKNYWQANNATINRDLVHLLTKRNNTGTGGIAYLDALCSYNWGYGFSASLNNDTSFNFPNPTYSWNLNVVSHEIGHNYGANHTHWCGWLADPSIPFAGGVIDNCVDVEGSCNNNPSPQVGTIMSYCHVGGTGVVLDFHEVVVSQALDPGILNANCLTTCDYYGCTDTSAFNYNPNATIDDGSCIPKIFGCIDVSAANYDLNANTDDGSCTYCASLSFTNTDISCAGSGDGIVFVNVNGSSGTIFTYEWFGPNGYFNTTNLNYINNLNLSGTYTVVVTDNFGCSDTAVTFLNEPLSININSINVTPPSCYGYNDGQVNLVISGGTAPYTFNYNGYNPNLLSAGNYSVVVSDNNNCPSVSTNFNVLEPLDINDNATITNISCHNFNDASINLSVTGGTSPYSYSWLGPNGYSSILPNIIGLSDGSYQLNILDSNNCSFTNIYNISNPSPIDTTGLAIIDVSCNGGNDANIFASFSGGTPPYLYSWNTGDTSAQLSNIPAGNYNLSVTDFQGCSFPTMYFTISEPLPSNMYDSVFNIDCFGNASGSIDITYITSNSSISTYYSWQGPNGFSSNLEDLNNLYAGTYILNVIENNNCQNTFSFVVSEPDMIQVNENIQNVSCYNGSDGVVVLDVSGGTPLYSIGWNGYNPQSLSAGTYFYTILDGNNCLYSNSITITSPSTPIEVLDSVTNVTCYNYMNGTANLYISGGIPPYIESWPNSNPNLLSFGFHVFEILDGNNCLFSDSVYISQPTQISATVQTVDVICNSLSTGSASIQVNGGNPPYNFLWSNADTSQVANNLSAGSYIFYVTDNNGCQLQGIASINQTSPIVTQTTISPSSCIYSNDGQVTLNINGGFAPYTQDWLGYNSSALVSGLYEYIITDSLGCIDSNQVYIHCLSDIQVAKNINNVTCNDYCDANINLIVSNGIAPYQINYFDDNNLNVLSNQLCEGIYTYEIIDNIGCQFIDTFEILQPSILNLQIQYVNNILEANVSGGTSPYTFQWWNSSGNLSNSQQLFTTNPGTYFAIAYDANNCHSDTISYKLQDLSVVDQMLDFYIYPNPVKSVLHIDLNRKYDQITCVFTDVLSKKIMDIDLKNTKSFKLDCTDFSSGIYFLRFNIDNINFSKKVIIK